MYFTLAIEWKQKQQTASVRTLNAEKMSATLAEAISLCLDERGQCHASSLMTRQSIRLRSLINLRGHWVLNYQNDSHPYVKCTWKYWAFLWVPTLFFRQIVRFFNELRSHIKICDNATNELKLSKRRQSKRECNNKERNRSNKQNKSFESASDFQTDFFTWSEWNAIV